MKTNTNAFKTMVITEHEALQYTTLASVGINKLLLRALDA
jgi:hypothetical protein